jgi:hypothetical protein
VFKRVRRRDAGDSLNPLEDEFDEPSGQPVAEVRVDVSSQATDRLLLPGRDFEIIDRARLVVRHRGEQMDTILRGH